jgi:hypothetical protein
MMVMTEVDLEVCCHDLIQCSHYINLVKVRENKINLIGFHASTAVWMRSSLFWVVTKHTLAVVYQCFGTDMPFQNTDKQLSTYAA